MTTSLVGETTNRLEERVRVPLNVSPGVRERLRTLLMQPQMRGVGYSEFINRACEVAENEIHKRRHRPEGTDGHGQ